MCPHDTPALICVSRQLSLSLPPPQPSKHDQRTQFGVWGLYQPHQVLLRTAPQAPRKRACPRLGDEWE